MNPLYITFILYLSVMIGIGIFTYFRTKSYSDYVLGGRGLGSWVTAISAQAADFSGWILMGLPGAAYASGLGKSSLYICIFTAIGAMLNWKFVARRLRIYTERSKNSLTLSSFLENRFHDEKHILKSVTSFFIILFFTGYVAAGFTSGGVLFESLFGIDYITSVILGAFVIVAYTFLGGFLAVTFTELVQGIIMFVTLILTPLLGIMTMGGVSPVLDKIAQLNIDLLSAVKTVDYAQASLNQWTTTGSITIITVLSAIGWGLGYFGQPHILIRFMSIQDHRNIAKSRLIALTIGNVFPLYGTIIVGLLGLAYYNGTNALSNPETVFIHMVQDFFNPWLAGFFLSAIMAAIMSTISSQLLVASSSFAEDIYKGFIKKTASDKELILVGRIAVLTIAAIGLLLSFKGGKILDLVGYAWSGFGAAFGPVILYSLFWKRITLKGAISGIITGGLTVILWKYTGSALFDVIPGFILASIAIPIVSLLDNPVTQEIQDEFDAVCEEANSIQPSRNLDCVDA